MRLAGDKEGKGKNAKGNDNGDEGGVQRRGGGQQGNGDGNKDGGQVDCDGNKECNGDGNKGGGGATVTATKRAMATVMAVVGSKEGKGNGGKIVGIGNKGGWQATAMRAMVMRVAGE